MIYPGGELGGSEVLTGSEVLVDSCTVRSRVVFISRGAETAVVG